MTATKVSGVGSVTQESPTPAAAPSTGVRSGTYRETLVALRDHARGEAVRYRAESKQVADYWWDQSYASDGKADMLDQLIDWYDRDHAEVTS